MRGRKVRKDGEGGPGVGPLAPVDVWRGQDVHVDVAGRGRKKLPQGIAVPPSVHKASFQRAVRKVMNNLWRVPGFEFKGDKYPPETPAPTGGGGGGPATSPGSLVPAGMDVRYTGSPPKGVHREKYRQSSAPGGAGAGAVEAMETTKHLPGQHEQADHAPDGTARAHETITDKQASYLQDLSNWAGERPGIFVVGSVARGFRKPRRKGSQPKQADVDVYTANDEISRDITQGFADHYGREWQPGMEIPYDVLKPYHPPITPQVSDWFTELYDQQEQPHLYFFHAGTYSLNPLGGKKGEAWRTNFQRDKVAAQRLASPLRGAKVEAAVEEPCEECYT